MTRGVDDDPDAPAAVFTGEIHGVADVGAEAHDAVLGSGTHVAGEVEPPDLRLLLELP